MNLFHVLLVIIKRVLFWDRLYPYLVDSSLFHFWHQMNAMIASSIYSDPTADMVVIGVTGTDGKTTTVNMLHHILTQLGQKTVMISTTGVKIGTQDYPNQTKMSSPSPYTLNSILSDAKKAGCTHAIIETTSHGLHQSRFYGIKYSAGLLTNITAEHLDYHKTIEEYAKTKRILFEMIATSDSKVKVGVFNKDDEFGRKWSVEIPFDKTFDFAVAMNATFKGENIVEYMDKTVFDCKYLGKSYSITTQLVGRFNVYNILGCIACCAGLGFDVVDSMNAVSSFAPLVGRQHMVVYDERTYIIDFAHTPNALEQMLGFVSRVNPGKRIITLFGAPGRRDKFKRPQMGYIIEQLSTVVILTEDDSMDEPTASIIGDVAKGIAKQEGNDYYIIPERDLAIRFAYHISQPGDIIVLAGKGHETKLYTNFGKRKFSDVDYLMAVIDDTHEQYHLDNPLEPSNH